MPAKKKNVIKYVGRYVGVTVPDLGSVYVEKGQQVEVESDDLALSLLEQPSNWEWVSGVKHEDPALEEDKNEEGESE